MKKILSLMFLFPALSFAQGFSDVGEAHPNFNAIEWFFSNGLVEGYRVDKERIFKPEEEVSRAAALKMLINASGIPIVDSLSRDPFLDVPAREWFAPFVQTAVNKDVVQGFPDGNFYPAASVTRAELLAMVLRLFDAPLEESVDGGWQTPFLELAQQFGIVDGVVYGDTVLTRGEVAEILYRARKVAEAGFTTVFRYSGSGSVSAYPTELLGKKTANGDILNASSITAAHSTLPFGTRVRMWNDNTMITARINDRIPADASDMFLLSQKAFSLLADKGQKTTMIAFEIFSSPTDVPPSIPEYVRPSFSAERQEQPPLPESVSGKIAELRGQTQNTVSVRPVFTETVAMLSTGFFDDFVMRKPFPLKIIAGTVFNFSGTAHEWGHKEITVFLQPITNTGEKIGEQIPFTGKISGKNFSFPVIFDQSGKFVIGAVLDEDNTSRVETTEVIDVNRFAVLPLSKKTFESDFSVRVVPENQTVIWDLPTLDSEDILKISFTQNSISRTLFLSAGITELSLPYEWFALFQPQENLAVDLYAAESIDGSIPQRISGWTQLGYQNFDLLPGFFDVETDKVSIHTFPRWRRNLDTFVIRGEVLNSSVTLPETAFITTPSGYVLTVPYTKNGDRFSFSVTPQEWGAYAIEIIANDGEVLFNRQLYCTEKLILPILPPKTTLLSSETVAGVRYWINQIRAEMGASQLLGSAELNEFAQGYADRMANENFLSHTSPTGQTFQSRIEAAGLVGIEFGENLGKGSSLQMALNGLQSSGSHFKNISARKWERVGIGISQQKKEWYTVQVFAR